MLSISSFSGCTKGLHTLAGIATVGDRVQLKLRSPLPFLSRYEKKIDKYRSPAISIDGVYAEFSYSQPSADGAQNFEVVAKVAKEAFLNSALSRLKCGEQVNVGLLSTNRDKWLLGGSPVGTVTLRSIKTAEAHRFTKELAFECSDSLFDPIKKAAYIGLNSSAFMVKDVFRTNGRVRFSIHAGQNSMEKTIFGKKDLELGSDLNLALPFDP